MKHLIVARHGDYDSTLHLDDTGRGQMLGLYDQLKQYTDGQRVALLSSTAPRASESATVLAQLLGVDVQLFEVFWSDGNHAEDMSAAMEIIRKFAAHDVVIVVTHLEYIQELPAYFGEQELKVQFLKKILSRGRAWVIDCEQKTMKSV